MDIYETIAPVYGPMIHTPYNKCTPGNDMVRYKVKSLINDETYEFNYNNNVPCWEVMNWARIANSWFREHQYEQMEVVEKEG
jgi:hypothetical protein